MIGRTHLQDATPVTLGQVISGWVAQLDDARAALAFARARPVCRWRSAAPRSAPGSTRIRALRRARGARRSRAKPACRSSSAHEQVRRTVGARRDRQRQRGAAHARRGALMKIANDVRWYASGPRAGFGEITIPDNEPGSSIMPGKINPTQCEALTMVAVHVFGNDAAVAFGGTQGNFQLNVYKPVMLHGVLESIELLADAMPLVRRALRAAASSPNSRASARNVERSLMLVTALNPHIGYENAAKIALKAHREGTDAARRRACSSASSAPRTSTAGSIRRR